jgi:hypothetical protein
LCQLEAIETHVWLAEVAPTVDGDADPSRIDLITLEELGRRNRLQTIAFNAEAEVFAQRQPGWPGNRELLLGQRVRIALRFLVSERIEVLPALFARAPLRRRILLTLNMNRIVQHLFDTIRLEKTSERKLVLDRERSVRSTGDVLPWDTSKPRALYPPPCPFTRAGASRHRRCEAGASMCSGIIDPLTRLDDSTPNCFRRRCAPCARAIAGFAAALSVSWYLLCAHALHRLDALRPPARAVETPRHAAPVPEHGWEDHETILRRNLFAHPADRSDPGREGPPSAVHASSRLLQAALAPRWDGDELVGMEISGIEPSSLYEAIGLRNGDVIADLNGIRVMGPEDSLKLLFEFSQAERFRVKILAGSGDLRTLEFERPGTDTGP